MFDFSESSIDSISRLVVFFSRSYGTLWNFKIELYEIYIAHT